MTKPAAPTAPCKLCGTTAVLQWSHIIPRWTYRRLIATEPGGSTNPVRVSDGVALTSGEQDAEYMLCRPCEERFGPSERYVASIALNEEGAFPALAKTDALVSAPGAEWSVGNASALDCAAITYFAASVVWRQSVSTRFPKVSLGPVYGATFAEYLLGRAPFPPNARLMVEFIRPTKPPRVDRTVATFGGKRGSGYHIYQFIVFGIWFRMMVGGVLPEGLRSVSFVDTNLVLLSDGQRFLGELLATARNTVPKGSLAHRPSRRRRK